MRSILIFTGIFEKPADLQRSERATRRLLDFLVQMNLDHLKLYPDTPRIYSSGIRYDRDIHWKDIYACLATGGGDCKSVAAWRVAELIHSGEDPKAVCHLKGGPLPGGGSRYHVTVKRGNGRIEDPSKILGM